MQILKKDINILEYEAIHWWIRRHYGNPVRCDKCGKKGEKVTRRWNIEWALKPNTQYSRNINDFDKLCTSCHIRQDRGRPEVCQESNCINPHFSKLLCKKHYQLQYEQENKEYISQRHSQHRIKIFLEGGEK